MSTYSPSSSYNRFGGGREKRLPFLIPRPADTPFVLPQGNSKTPPHASFGGDILVVSHSGQVAEAIRLLMADGAAEYGVGLDLEWKPSFYSRDGKTESGTSLIQVSTEHICCIFWMTHLRGKMPEELRQLLQDPKIFKFGVGLGNEDSARLRREYGISALSSAVDISAEAKNYGFQKSSLKHLTEVLLGLHVNKSMRVSNWGSQTLSIEQLHYAAIDAYLSLLLYYKLKAFVAAVHDTSLDRHAIFLNDSIATLAKFARLAPAAFPTIPSSKPRMQCKSCTRFFDTESSYNEHMVVTQHGEPSREIVIPPLPANCPKCSKRFETAQKYTVHLLRTGHDLASYTPDTLQWLPQVTTTATTRTVKFADGSTQLSLNFTFKAHRLQQSDFVMRKLRVSASGDNATVYTGRSTSPVIEPSEPAPVAAAAVTAESAPAGASLAHKAAAPAAPSVATVFPQADQITLSATVFKQMEAEIASLKKALEAERSRNAKLNQTIQQLRSASAPAQNGASPYNKTRKSRGGQRFKKLDPSSSPSSPAQAPAAAPTAEHHSS